MAVRIKGKKFTKSTIAKWQRQVNSGKRTLIEIERDELGTNGRGKTVSRLFQSELQNA